MFEEKMPKELAEEVLLGLFPYLEEELKEKTRERPSKEGVFYVKKEISILEKAVFYEVRKTGLPDPGVTMIPIDARTTEIRETKVDFVSEKEGLLRSLRRGELPERLATDSLSRSETKEVTNKVLEASDPKPDYVVVKRIKTRQVVRSDEIKHEYEIEVYKVR